MNKKLILSIILTGGLLTFSSCKDYFDYQPKGLLSSENIQSASGAESLVTAAYAGIGNDEMIGPMTSMWVYGSVRSDDAYKGGGGVTDVAEVDFYEHYNLTRADLGIMHPYTWENFYKAISRANAALASMNNLTEAQFSMKKERTAEVRFLRAHSHFMLKMLFKKIPFITEDLTAEQILNTPNDEFTNDQLWDKIGEDFQYAIDNLPERQEQIGRANKYAAAAYLAKLRLFQAYEQNEQHQVTNINKEKLQQVVKLTQQVINSGQYSLQPDFAENFIAENENGPESIFAIQYSINDGTAAGRLSYVTGLNYPHGAPQYGCCGFHQPSQTLVNAFKTTAAGLPDFSTYNDKNLDIATNTVDPRMDHTVGIDGHPYKYDNTKPMSNSWIRDPGVYGFYHTMKEQQLATSPSYHKEGPFIGSSKNIDIIRFDDVLLMQAEAYIELGQLEMARPLINQIRIRAANSTGRLKMANGEFASKYNIKEYPSTGWDQETARQALRWERRLEFATESPRFFDLVRWGIASEVLNKYIEIEKVRRPFLSTAKFTAGRDEYLPIPQREITFTKGLYKQNPGF